LKNWAAEFLGRALDKRLSQLRQLAPIWAFGGHRSRIGRVRVATSFDNLPTRRMTVRHAVACPVSENASGAPLLYQV